MDIVWLKKDARIHDHGPLEEISRDSLRRNYPVLILYLYEQDQLAEPTVHGSHLRFIQEGLVDLDKRLSGNNESASFQSITVCHATMLSTMEEIHRKHHRVGRLLAHEETGHWQSFMRDIEVRKWCRQNGVQFVEYNQTGVTRRLRNRDHYSKQFKAFVAKSRCATPKIESIRNRLILLSSLPGFLPKYELDIDTFTEIPVEHRKDRPKRQQTGGETQALATLTSFLRERGAGFSQGISSPNSSWTSCSRLSPYLTWGHISLRFVIHSLQNRQEQLRKANAQGRNTGSWLRSLQAFSSRIHWRSHFIQKLESEPELEKRELCRAYQPLRRQPGDWNEEFYTAWSTGKTGFPFVDACMRCLLEHGWLNFRMRAMLVSFATYNLWLDWKRIAPHLARVFLDYEPGIHYPQLQMQAGTTGINAMRVYSVTKQGKDQDPNGTFIRKYVNELENVPTQFIHEPWKMTLAEQRRCKVLVGVVSIPDLSVTTEGDECLYYPAPIVNEQESSKIAKAKVAAVRKQEETKKIANQVYQKHGSRNPRREELNGRKNKQRMQTASKDQRKLTELFPTLTAGSESCTHKMPSLDFCTAEASAGNMSVAVQHIADSVHRSGGEPKRPTTFPDSMERKKQKVDSFFTAKKTAINAQKSWNCETCTFLNSKPHGLVCSMCGTTRARGEPPNKKMTKTE